MSDLLTAQQRRIIAEDYRRRLGQCVPWSPAMKWERQLNIQAATYEIRPLFPAIAASDQPVETLEPGQFIDSPTAQFRYCVRLQRRGTPLLTWWGSQTGTVIFDGDVGIPALFQKVTAADGQRRWGASPWMSLTPAELLTLRPGTRMARGHVVVAGLGLGHQLIEVSRRLQVKRITLVEVNQELVDWLLPTIRRHMKKPVKVIVDDAYKAIPKLKADIALIDIFPGYGGAQAKIDALARRSPKIKKFWGWGTSEMSGRMLTDR